MESLINKGVIYEIKLVLDKGEFDVLKKALRHYRADMNREATEAQELGNPMFEDYGQECRIARELVDYLDDNVIKTEDITKKWLQAEEKACDTSCRDYYEGTCPFMFPYTGCHRIRKAYDEINKNIP